MASSCPALLRRLTTTDAVVIGLGSMIGAGVFAAFGPAAKAAGSGLLIGLVIAAIIAYCNAAASAQLAAAYPTSGGTYIYGRERLGEWWGFLAGWGFVIGKTASCAAMALTFASYVLPSDRLLQRVVAIIAVVALTSLNYRGVTRTAAMTKILVSLSLTCLAVVVVSILVAGDVSSQNLDGWWQPSNGPYGILQAGGLIFFAFAGYARIATMGEEVLDPAQTIPRAIQIALAITVVVYVLVAVTILMAAGANQLARSTAPLVTAVNTAGVGGIAPVVRVGAAIASLGALLALIAGIGRTSLAMARNRDLPSWLAAVHPRYRVPHHAEVTLAVVVSTLVMLVDLRGVIGFSSFGVLIYYAVANASAFTQPREQRRWPRLTFILGLIGCLILVATLPWLSIALGVVMVAIGMIGRIVVLRQRQHNLANQP